MIRGIATALFSTTVNSYGKKYKTQSGKILTTQESRFCLHSLSHDVIYGH